uniref:Uncharacterized protein n=1 Tax=viral metagenome TaxID=1070528 RepID=A0A6C0JBY2_9ZZZZ
MPRKYQRKYQKRQTGSGCAVDPVINVPCSQNVDVSVYGNPCSMFSNNNVQNKVGGGYYLDVGKSIGGQAPVNAVFDQNAPIVAPKQAHQYPTPFYMQQTGGAYQYITNPSTGRKVRLDGKIGKQVLKNYLNMTGGAEGLESNFSGDMNNRTFGCRQPDWNPNCV